MDFHAEKLLKNKKIILLSYMMIYLCATHKNINYQCKSDSSLLALQIEVQLLHLSDKSNSLALVQHSCVPFYSSETLWHPDDLEKYCVFLVYFYKCLGHLGGLYYCVVHLTVV